MADQLDLVFKKIVSRQYSAAVKSWYEEDPGVPFKLKGSDVWVDTIPETPPEADTAVVKIYNKITLTNNTTVASNKAWYAEVDGESIGNFIQPRYGQDYTARLYDGSNNEIPTTDNCGWFFDYETGILTFDSNPASAGWDTSSFQVYCFRYVGSTADDIWESLQGSVWQEPVISKTGTVPLEPTIGDRYLVDSPTEGSDWDEHDDAIAYYDGVAWQFITTTAGMIAYVIDQDKLYQYDDNSGWDWSGLDAVDLDYNNDDSDIESVTVKQALDELDRLIKTTETVFYVDKNRSDSYTETGTIIKPYKTLTSAVQHLPSDTACTLELAPGTYVGDGVLIPDSVSVRGNSTDGVSITGELTLGTLDSTSLILLENVECDVVYCQSEVLFQNIIADTLHIKNVCEGLGLTVSSNNANSNGVTLYSGATLKATHGEIQTSENEFAILNNGGVLELHGFDVFGESDNDLISSPTGVVRLYDSKVANSGTGEAMSIDNGAASSNPNILVDVHHVGDIKTGSAITIVEGVTGGNPISTVDGATNQIYRGGTQLKNDSSIIKDAAGGTLVGLTINDSIDRVASVVKYDETLGGLIISTCVDNIE